MRGVLCVRGTKAAIHGTDRLEPLNWGGAQLVMLHRFAAVMPCVPPEECTLQVPSTISLAWLICVCKIWRSLRIWEESAWPLQAWCCSERVRHLQTTILCHRTRQKCHASCQWRRSLLIKLINQCILSLGFNHWRCFWSHVATAVRLDLFDWVCPAESPVRAPLCVRW